MSSSRKPPPQTSPYKMIDEQGVRTPVPLVPAKSYGVSAFLTQDLIDRAKTCVSAGNFRQTVRQRLGINPSTFRTWLRKGREEVEDWQSEGSVRTEASLTMYAKLYLALEHGEGDAHHNILQDVLDSDDPKVKLEFLKKRYANLYSPDTGHFTGEGDEEDVIRSGVDILMEKLELLSNSIQRDEEDSITVEPSESQNQTH